MQMDLIRFRIFARGLLVFYSPAKGEEVKPRKAPEPFGFVLGPDGNT
jgi:hypothetical protein